MKLFVGIDVSSKKLDVCFLDSEDTRLKEETLSNDINGASKIKESILAYNRQFHYGENCHRNGIHIRLQFPPGYSDG